MMDWKLSIAKITDDRSIHSKQFQSKPQQDFFFHKNQWTKPGRGRRPYLNSQEFEASLGKVGETLSQEKGGGVMVQVVEHLSSKKHKAQGLVR
jgi:hypothetical protein